MALHVPTKRIFTPKRTKLRFSGKKDTNGGKRIYLCTRKHFHETPTNTSKRIMIIPSTYLSNVILVVPITSAVLSSLVTFLSLRDSQSNGEKKQRWSAIAFFITNLFGCIFLYLYEFYPEIFAYVSSLSILAFVLFFVSIYRTLFFLTALDENERFTPLHYVAPLAFTAMFGLFQLVIPYHLQVKYVLDAEAFALPPNEIYGIIFEFRHYFESLFAVVYVYLSLTRVYAYYKKISNASGKAEKNSIRWMVFLIFFCLITSFATVVALYVPRQHFGTSPWAILSTVFIVWLHLDLTYHLIIHKYQLNVLPVTAPENDRNRHRGRITRHQLERFYKKEKPYLSPDFRMTHLVKALDVNRTAISNFINRTYGMSFSRYTNHWRLKEMERLKTMFGNDGKRTEQLVQQAGFSDVKQYLRAKALEEADRPGPAIDADENDTLT